MNTGELKITGFLLEWAENYFRSRDAFHKKIISIENKDNYLLITSKDKKEKIFAISDLDSFKELGIRENTSIITINNRKNVEFLYDNWDKLTDFSSLRIYFINPISTTEKKWVINPHIHSKVCDKDTLKAGLMAMFETVDPLTQEILQARL